MTKAMHIHKCPKCGGSKLDYYQSGFEYNGKFEMWVDNFECLYCGAEGKRRFKFVFLDVILEEE